tara:strand:+ start:1902 stop:2219 length:318 start_codon:yes stop_codon:yes gene_type:complete
MLFIEDIWNEIKKFVFHRHLWMENQDKLKVLTSLKLMKQSEMYISPMMVVSPKESLHKFVKIYEYFMHYSIVTLIYIPMLLRNQGEIDNYIHEIWSTYSIQSKNF